MHQQPPGTHRFVTVAEAVRMLGMSATTIRRKIEAGELEAERVARPQGTAFLVKVPEDEPPRAVDAPATPPERPTTSHEAPPTHHDVPPPTDHMVAMVVPLVAQIDALRQTVERQAGEIADLREERGRHTAELERAASTIVALGEENEALRTSQAQRAANSGRVIPEAATAAPVPISARLRALAPWVALALAVLAIVAVIVLLVAPRW